MHETDKNPDGLIVILATGCLKAHGGPLKICPSKVCGECFVKLLKYFVA